MRHNEAREARSAEFFFLGFSRETSLFISDRIPYHSRVGGRVEGRVP